MIIGNYEIPQGTLDIIQGTVEPTTNDSLTTKEVGGTGVFDVLMSSFSNHLKEEFNGGRISGAEYTQAYIALTESAMSNAIEFLVQRDQIQWNAVNAQIQANIGMATLETAVEQLELTKEQVEAARGQTTSTRRDGQPIVGVIGSQIDLQKQQKITFQKDMELKAAKVFSDAWTVMKSIDEGLTPPDSFSNENVDRILSTIA